MAAWRHALGGFLLAGALHAPVPAVAVDYLTAGQAQAALFPEADHFQARELLLSPADRAALQARLGLPVRDRWKVRQAYRGKEVAGTVVIDDVIGKLDRITFAVGVGVDGAVSQVEILSYRESHGEEVRLASWRRQFVGKTAASPLRAGQDIDIISGATLSCSHVADGVRRIVAVLDRLARSGALR